MLKVSHQLFGNEEPIRTFSHLGQDEIPLPRAPVQRHYTIGYHCSIARCDLCVKGQNPPCLLPGNTAKVTDNAKRVHTRLALFRHSKGIRAQAPVPAYSGSGVSESDGVWFSPSRAQFGLHIRASRARYGYDTPLPIGAQSTIQPV